MQPYGAKDIEKLLGINRNKLFFWVHTKRLIKPEIEEVRGTGKGNKFSFKNLLDLSIIKILDGYGFGLNAIQVIMMPGDYHIKDPKSEAYKIIRIKNLWNFIKEHREFYKKEGCALFVTKERHLVTLVHKEEGKDQVYEEKYIDFNRTIITKSELRIICGEGTPYFQYGDFFIIDLLENVELLENQAEDKI
jgi:hypothetical protein